MKLETFFDKFELFADAPDAVAKMRELVLQLAVRGKLVAQHPAEGDADSLIDAMSAARKPRYKGKVNTSASIEVLTESERWFDVPRSWRWVRLGDVGEIVGGGTPQSTNSAYFADRGVPWLTPADLNGFVEKRISRGRRFITQFGLDNSSARLLPAGSVLFSSRAPIGYVAIAGSDLATNQGFKSCVPFVPETNEFLYYYLKSAASRIDREAPGTTFREVSGKAVSQIPVPLPPLAEQKRIVAKVDELMALCDRLEAQRQERETRHAALSRAALARFAEAPTPANLEFLFHNAYAIPPIELRKSIRTLAVQGRLVPRDFKDGCARDELRRIGKGDARAARASGHVGEPPYQLPDTWTWEKLGSLGVIGSSRRVHQRDWVASGVPFLRAREIVALSKYGSVANELFITEQHYRVLADKGVIPEAGDIMVTGVGTIGVPYVVRTGDRFYFKDASVLIFKNVWNLCADYLRLVMESPYWIERVHEGSMGTTVHTLTISRVCEVAVPIPPRAEQRRIVAKVDELMALVDKLEAELTSARTTATSLLTAAIAELTNGKEPLSA